MILKPKMLLSKQISTTAVLLKAFRRSDKILILYEICFFINKLWWFFTPSTQK